MSKLEACKAALEQQENEYRSLVNEALEYLRDEAMNGRARGITEEMTAEALKRLTAHKLLTKGAKVLEAKKKFNKEKSMQVPTIYPKPLMDAVEMGEIENVTKYPYIPKRDSVKFRINGFTSKELLFYWDKKEVLYPSYKLNSYKECKAPLEIFNRIKKELEGEK